MCVVMYVLGVEWEKAHTMRDGKHLQIKPESKKYTPPKQNINFHQNYLKSSFSHAFTLNLPRIPHDLKVSKRKRVDVSENVWRLLRCAKCVYNRACVYVPVYYIYVLCVMFWSHFVHRKIVLTYYSVVHTLTDARIRLFIKRENTSTVQIIYFYYYRCWKWLEAQRNARIFHYNDLRCNMLYFCLRQRLPHSPSFCL